MLKYSEEEDTIDYIIFIIHESTEVNCIKIKLKEYFLPAYILLFYTYR